MPAIRLQAARPDSVHDIAIPVASGGLGAARFPGLAAPATALGKAAAAAARFDGEAGGIVDFVADTGAGIARILLVGTGAGADADWEKAGSAIVARLLVSGTHVVAVDVSGTDATAANVAALASGAAARGWRFDRYRSRLPQKQKPTLDEVVIVGAPEGSEDAWSRGAAVIEGLSLTRELVSEPPNIIYPESFVERCRELEALGVEIEVLGEAQMAEAGMGALLAVSKGSAREGQLLVMRWNGTGDAGDPPLALVGKGVTFDTGGISLKPGPGMEDMKWDMGGAGAVAGAMKAIAGRKAKAHVVGVCGLVENMPDGEATRPGDVVTSMSGQTIEILNTDAEGRLVLCDAIAWVQKRYRPKTIVDLATLTGAMVISLGSEHGGLFANDESLAEELLAASRTSGDALWRFPLSPAYDKLIDSPIADMKNVGPRGAGSITAAQFIKRFVDEGVRWAHLDIAGMVWADKPGTRFDKGATGFGVRLLDRFVADTLEGGAGGQGA
ncbi:leucyl aminopeptidase [Sphingomonas jejuensis]|uniref:Probable cytosol aminopeptidase n=1 Tax=Sphingomonas jejuensis TaxID=904715 RepID=A0ABX0XKF4_9SPHN|nr:leucyl aminopeptidase [Sphingomonas jejuensis]NJC33337.1 leucyl aminopeptidase [Sphingomonas jejuensis]